MIAAELRGIESARRATALPTDRLAREISLSSRRQGAERQWCFDYWFGREAAPAELLHDVANVSHSGRSPRPVLPLWYRPLPRVALPPRAQRGWPAAGHRDGPRS